MITVDTLMELVQVSGRTIEDVVALWSERIDALVKAEMPLGEALKHAFEDVSTQLLREAR